MTGGRKQSSPCSGRRVVTPQPTGHRPQFRVLRVCAHLPRRPRRFYGISLHDAYKSTAFQGWMWSGIVHDDEPVIDQIHGVRPAAGRCHSDAVPSIHVSEYRVLGGPQLYVILDIYGDHGAEVEARVENTPCYTKRSTEWISHQTDCNKALGLGSVD